MVEPQLSDGVTIPLAVLHDDRLSLNEIRVFVALMQSAGDSNGYSCTRAELQRTSAVQRISRHTQNLSRAGYIRIEKHGEGNRNSYTMLTDSSTDSDSQGMTLGTFVREYFEFSAGVHTAKTVKTYRTAFREFERVEGDRPLQVIGIRAIEHFLSVKKSEAPQWTARKYYIALSSAFEKAVQWQYLTENPFRKVPKPKVREILPEYFSERDFRLFLTVIRERDFRELCIVALLTGLRLGELLSLRWVDVDFTARVIVVRNSETFTTKTKRNRAVPMSEALCRLLRERQQNLRFESETVFYSEKGRPLAQGTVSQRFKRYVRRAGLNDRLHFHSLRHSFASALVASGVSLYAVQKLLGHTTSKTTEIYSHLLPQQLHDEVNTLARQFALQGITKN